MLIGVQTFGIEKELTNDMEGTLRALHEKGFHAVEPVVLPNEKQEKLPKNLWAMDTLTQAKQIMDELGMKIPSVHMGIGFGAIAMPAGMAVKKMLAIHEKIGVRCFVISGPFGKTSTAKKWGRLAAKIAAGLKPYGCTLVYHNHDDEFHTVMLNGKSMSALDCFFTFAGSDVRLQLDIGWASLTGEEMKIARCYADRIVSLHLKDFYPGYRDGGFTRANMPESLFAPIGSGVVKTADIVSLQDTFPNFNGSIIIDQDKYSGDMMEALDTGIKNINAMLLQRRDFDEQIQIKSYDL